MTDDEARAEMVELVQALAELTGKIDPEFAADLLAMSDEIEPGDIDLTGLSREAIMALL